MSNEASLRDGDMMSTAATIIVHGQDELNAALANATGGETIALAAADYDSIYLRDRAFDDTVTIVSADEGERAVFTGRISLANVSNLSFSGVDVVGDEPLAQYTPRVALYGSDHVSLGDMEISGVIPTTGVDPDGPNTTGREVMIGFAHEWGVVVRDSSQIDVDRVEVTNANIAVAIQGSEDVNVLNSEFHEIRSDGVTVVGSQNIHIDNNYFHDFYPWRTPDGSGGDHPDFVQFFGARGDGGVHGLTVRDNIMVQGDGDWTQSVFGHNSTGNSDGQAFTDFEISGNFIQNGHQHGITLGDVNGARVFDNVLIPSGVEDPLNSSGKRPTIDISNNRTEDGGSNIEIRDNVLTLGYGETYTPRSAGDDAEMRGVSVFDNEVLEVGKTVGEFWRELDLPETPASGELAGWIADARAEVLSAFGHDVAPPESGEPTDEDDQAPDEPAEEPTDEPAEEPAEPTTPDAEITLPNRGAPTHEGGDGSDGLYTGNGEEVVLGGAGEDTLYTRGGDDWLEAGAGDDRLVGGAGSDVMFGGDGADAFDFYGFDLAGSGQDVIADFSFAEGDHLKFVHFDEGAFAGEFDSLQAFGTTGKHANVQSFADLVELDDLEGFAVTRSGETALTLEMQSSHGVGQVEIMFDAGAGLDEFWSVPADEQADEPTDEQVDEPTDEPADEPAEPTTPDAEITLPNRGAPTHEGGDGSDGLYTGNGEEVVLGGAGEDTLYTRGGDDWLEAGAGDDRLVGGAGSDVMFGGDGADAFDFYGSDLAGSSEDVIADFSFAEGDHLKFVHFDEGAFAGEFDSLQAFGTTGKHANVQSFAGLAELDDIEGFAITRSGEAALTLEMQSSHGVGQVEINFDAGAGLDEFWSVPADEQAEPTTPDAEITLPNRGAPTHEGGDGSDGLYTGNGEEVVLGGAGEDTLYTRGGDDWLEAGAGDDRLVGGGGSDVMFGGDGADAFDFYGSDLAGSGQDVIADLSFAEGDHLKFVHFDDGAFAGEFDSLQAFGTTGKHANVRSFADLVELDELEGFAVSRTGESSLGLEMESSHGASRVELMFAAEANVALDQFWDLA